MPVLSSKRRPDPILIWNASFYHGKWTSIFFTATKLFSSQNFVSSVNRILVVDVMNYDMATKLIVLESL